MRTRGRRAIPKDGAAARGLPYPGSPSRRGGSCPERPVDQELPVPHHRPPACDDRVETEVVVEDEDVGVLALGDPALAASL